MTRRLLAAPAVLAAAAAGLAHAAGAAPHSDPGQPWPAASAAAAQSPSAPTAIATAGRHDGERIVIRELGIDLPIVAGDGYNAPLYVAAQYPGLGWPGEGSRTVLYAHDRPGMFAALSRARPGEVIEISGAGAPVLRYVVTDYYPAWPISDARWLEPAARDELVLITCTTYNYNDPRQIVVAERRP